MVKRRPPRGKGDDGGGGYGGRRAKGKGRGGRLPCASFFARFCGSGGKDRMKSRAGVSGREKDERGKKGKRVTHNGGQTGAEQCTRCHSLSLSLSLSLPRTKSKPSISHLSAHLAQGNGRACRLAPIPSPAWPHDCTAADPGVMPGESLHHRQRQPQRPPPYPERQPPPWPSFVAVTRVFEGEGGMGQKRREGWLR